MSRSWKCRTKPMRRSRTPRSSSRPKYRALVARTAGIGRIVAGDGIQQQRVVGHRAGQRPDMVEREGQRKHAAPRHQAIGRLQPDDAAGAGRIAHRSAGVGAERQREQPGADAGAGAGRRAARMMVRIPRVARRRKRQVEARPADGEFMRRQLAQDDRAGLPQLRRSPPRPPWRRCRAGSSSGTVVGSPATSMMSLMPTGTPCSGPRTRPAAISASAARAAAIAASASSRMKACSFGSSRSIRASRAFSSSTGDSSARGEWRAALRAVQPVQLGHRPVPARIGGQGSAAGSVGYARCRPCSQRLCGRCGDIIRKFRERLVQAGGARQFRDEIACPCALSIACAIMRLQSRGRGDHAIETWSNAKRGHRNGAVTANGGTTAGGGPHRRVVAHWRDIGEETGHRPKPAP